MIASTPFDPETAWLFEIGAKTEWFDQRLRLNIAGFYTDYKNLQILQLLVPDTAPPGVPGILITQNAANAEVKGIEVEFTVVPADGWTVRGSYTYLDTSFSNFFIPDGFRPPDGSTGGNTSRVGNRLRNAPKHAFNILMRYDHLLTNGGTVSAQADWLYKGTVFQDPDNLDFASVPSYDVANARLSYTLPSGDVEIAAWVKNLADEDYLLHNFPAAGSGFATPAPPRTYGVTVNWKM